jgi:probable F420-dependent oxidoreductase
MQFGLSMFITDETIAPVALGRAAEDAGFDALFVPEHTHIPASRESAWPGGDELPREYSHTLDPFVALSAIAATTERLRVGTGIALIVERDPITLAHEAATLDHVSGGRFELGIGAGWNLEEMRNHGTDPATRFRVMRERVLAMREIWTREEASFHGEFVDFDRIWSWPKPVQRPHLPVLVGGTGPHVLDRVLEYGDAWFPNMRDLDELATRIAELQGRAAEAGRERIPVTYFGARDPDDAMVEKMAAAGVDRVLFMLPPLGADETLPRLERYAELAARHR